MTAAYLGDAAVAAGVGRAGGRARVLRATPTVSTAGTAWDVRRADAKVVHVGVAGAGGPIPTGTVEVQVNGRRAGPPGRSTARGARRSRCRRRRGPRSSRWSTAGDASYTGVDRAGRACSWCADS